MAIIGSINITTRRIQLDTGVTAVSDILAFWREYRDLRVADTDSVRQSVPVMTIIGGQSKGGGKFVGRIIDLNGYKIIPDNLDHSLDVTVEIIDSGNGLSGRNVFDRTTLTADVNIDINIAPVEVITINTGSGVSAQDIIDIKDAVWEDEENPTGPNTKAAAVARIDNNTQTP